MLISLNWLKKFTAVESPPAELAKLIGSRLVEIEEVIDLGARYEGVVVAEIKHVEKHPDADKLNVYLADDARVTPDVERNGDGLVRVVSGDRNLRAGDKVAWLPPGSAVPSSYAEGEPFILGSREMRGIVSHGMFGSGKELDINNDAERVAVLDTDAPAGTSFATAYELNDYLLDIANKSLTHRPDCFGLVGFAREVAAIQGNEFTTPDWLQVLGPVLKDPQSVDGIGGVKVIIENEKMCPRYEAATIADVDVSLQSPLIIQSYLKRLGVRPINAVVDVTNYLMLVTGHPLHAFDYDKVREVQGGGETVIRVRGGQQGDTLTLLDGRTIEPTPDDILICAGNTPIALAGAMGGANTEVSESTKHIILEAATFNLYNLRSTSMRHGVFSEAATRFTKGQAAAQTAPVLASAIRMSCDIAGGTLAAPVADAYPSPDNPVAIDVSAAFINDVLGVQYTAADIGATLTRVNSVIDIHGAVLTVHVPYWRQDLHIPEDIAEEVGRLNGFDSIEPKLPMRPYEAVVPSTGFSFQARLRNRMVRMGANEVLTYSFVPERLLKLAGQDPAAAFRITNALSPSLQYYRLSLLPSLLEKAFLNSKAGYQEFPLFEFNKVHTKQAVNDDGLPYERPMLAMVYSSTKRKEADAGAAYFAAKSYLDHLLDGLDITPEYQPVADTAEDQLVRPYDRKRSARVMVSGQPVGVIGEVGVATAKQLKVPAYTAGFELDIEALERLAPVRAAYTPLGRFQGTTFDVCFRAPQDVEYQRLRTAVTEVLKKSDLRWSVATLDRYQREDDEAIQTTFRLELENPQQTITGDEVHRLADLLRQEVGDKTGAEVV